MDKPGGYPEAEVPVKRTDPEPGVLRKEMEVWAANGLIMMCDDGPHGWDAGELLVEDLLAFAEHAAKFFPGEKVYVHQYGLRVTSVTSTRNSPRLEWRDWT